ncbi:putative integral membrane protein [Babesia bovis T2Bo]|uniref:Uncharacterized protein n=1 Tax=Babesia bovis TaxID=5865 RepID=S6BL90_BABBO|nr:putative integral membrane protein [Babesia bovis T2Bo]KAG6440005.1 putative integral membrane protein [Babesia bovis T2Bo]BAN64752.1 hypothetical protein [Babesia bovis]
MLNFNETKAPDRVVPKPPMLCKRTSDIICTFLSGVILLSLIFKFTTIFFIAAALFLCRGLTSDSTIDWTKALMPILGIMPSMAKFTYDVFYCLLTGEPL